MQPISNTEARNSTRFEYRATLLVENFPHGSYHLAEMVNYSKNGVRFESNTPFKPGQKIVFAIENSPYESCPGVYWVMVKWCRKTRESESLYSYSMGAQYLTQQQHADIRSDMKANSDVRTASLSNDPTPGSPITNHSHPLAQYRSDTSLQRNAGRGHPTYEKRRHTRKRCSLSVRYFSLNGPEKCVVKNISKGGAYLARQVHMQVGQPLLIEFPGRKPKSTVKISSKVAWQDGSGCGVQFKKVVNQKV